LEKSSELKIVVPAASAGENVFDPASNGPAFKVTGNVTRYETGFFVVPIRVPMKLGLGLPAAVNGLMLG